MKRVFKTRPFSRWMQKTTLTNVLLCNAVDEMERGLIDANLGGGLVKKRIALPPQGKRGSVRTILATNKNNVWFFLLGFKKNIQANISKDELAGLKIIASDWLSMSEYMYTLLIKAHKIEEICHEEDI